MRKWLAGTLATALAVIIAICTTAEGSIGTDYGYVIVRCTIAISVDVLDANATAWFVAVGTDAGLSPNQADVSISSIGVRNTSSGAVVKWAVLVSSIQRSEDGANWISDDDDMSKFIKGWFLTTDGTLDAIGEFQLAAVFAKSRPSLDQFEVTENQNRGNDEFRDNLRWGTPTTDQRNTYTYKTNGEGFDPSTTGLRYPSALPNTSGTNAISPYPLDDSTRWMWFYVKTPAAVTDTFPRRIIIRVDAALVGAAW